MVPHAVNHIHTHTRTWVRFPCSHCSNSTLDTALEFLISDRTECLKVSRSSVLRQLFVQLGAGGGFATAMSVSHQVSPRSARRRTRRPNQDWGGGRTSHHSTLVQHSKGKLN